MFSKLKKQTEGFTIIEVLIVLAIAGLIMLIVFLAVPALQRNSRNTTRTSEGARISAAVTECLSNRNGVVASCATAASLNVGTLNQLSVTDASMSTVAATAPTTAASTTVAQIWYGNICTADGSAATVTGANSRSFAVIYQLEGAGAAITKCVAS
jgi:prepilin-type N-terminal cleavage/methylation domain-containing protein